MCSWYRQSVRQQRLVIKKMPSRKRFSTSEVLSWSNTVGTMNSGIMARETKESMLLKEGDALTEASESNRPGNVKQRVAYILHDSSSQERSAKFV